MNTRSIPTIVFLMMEYIAALDKETKPRDYLIDRKRINAFCSMLMRYYNIEEQIISNISYRVILTPEISLDICSGEHSISLPGSILSSLTKWSLTKELLKLASFDNANKDSSE